MLVALALILDMPFLKFKVGANGGSVSFTMVPLFVIAWRYGPIKSFLYIAVIYCWLSILLDGEPISSVIICYQRNHAEAYAQSFSVLFSKL